MLLTSGKMHSAYMEYWYVTGLMIAQISRASLFLTGLSPPEMKKTYGQDACTVTYAYYESCRDWRFYGAVSLFVLLKIPSSRRNLIGLAALANIVCRGGWPVLSNKN